jgi:hypothetical protein
LVSIIVPCKEVDEYAKECIEHCRRVTYRDYELILLPDSIPTEDIDKVRIVPTGSLTPGAKDIITAVA